MRTIGRQPKLFSGQLNADSLDDYGLVFSVAHNAGTSLKATKRAIASGADVIEIDVVSMGGTLISAHDAPMAYVGPAVFRGPTLGEAWRASAGARVIQLDLKESTPSYRSKVIAFLQSHPTDQMIVVATADIVMLDLMRAEVPYVFRFLSVPDSHRLSTLLENSELLDLIDGVTIRHQLVNAETVNHLKDEGIIVLAWTINDLATVNRLVAMGVDGVSTDNLAIMGLLGGEGRGEQRFEAYRTGSGVELPAANLELGGLEPEPSDAFEITG